MCLVYFSDIKIFYATFHIKFSLITQPTISLYFSLEKKELTIEKIANVITDTIMRFYDTNIQKQDVITLKTTLLLFLYSVCSEDKVFKLFNQFAPLHLSYCNSCKYMFH